MNITAISEIVDQAAPTLAQLAARQKAERQAQRATARTEALGRWASHKDKLREVRRAYQNAMAAEITAQNAIKHLCVRYGEIAAECAELEIAATLEQALGIKDSKATTARKSRLATLRDDAKGKRDQIPEHVRRLREQQEALPKLEEEYYRLQRTALPAMSS